MDTRNNNKKVVNGYTNNDEDIVIEPYTANAYADMICIHRGLAILSGTGFFLCCLGVATSGWSHSSKPPSHPDHDYTWSGLWKLCKEEIDDCYAIDDIFNSENIPIPSWLRGVRACICTSFACYGFGLGACVLLFLPKVLRKYMLAEWHALGFYGASNLLAGGFGLAGVIVYGLYLGELPSEDEFHYSYFLMVLSLPMAFLGAFIALKNLAQHKIF